MLVRESHQGYDGASLDFDEAAYPFAFAILHRCWTTVGQEAVAAYCKVFAEFDRFTPTVFA